MIYLVKIGRTTRKGNMIEPIERFIEAGENASFEIKKLLYPIYKGLDIWVSEIEPERLDIISDKNDSMFSPSQKVEVDFPKDEETKNILKSLEEIRKETRNKEKVLIGHIYNKYDVSINIYFQGSYKMAIKAKDIFNFIDKIREEVVNK